jgi:hypothetical protein
MQELSNAQSAVNVDVASPPIEFVEEAVADTSEPHSGISGTAIAVTAVGSALSRLKPRCFAGLFSASPQCGSRTTCAKHSLRSPSLRFAAFTGLAKSRKN